jgi:methylaspartate ammonia-lyase
LVSKPFSRKNVLDFEVEIHDSVRELTDIIRKLASGNVEVDISKALRCLSLDFITRFTYGESMHAVQTKDFEEEVLDAFDSFAPSNFLV